MIRRLTSRINANLVAFAAGLLLVTAGAYLIYLPAGLIIPGIVLMAISLFGDRKP